MRLAARGTGFTAGVLALAGFFLPWGAGPGPLASVTFSGYELVGYVGHFQRLELSGGESAAVTIARLFVLGIALAACWLAMMSPFAPDHALARWSGRYLAGAAIAILVLHALIHGADVPGVGLMSLGAAAAALVLTGLSRRAMPSVRRSWPRTIAVEQKRPA